MGKRTYLKFIGNCEVKKVSKTGQNVRVTMKCPKRVNSKIKSAQSYIDSA